MAYSYKECPAIFFLSRPKFSSRSGIPSTLSMKQDANLQFDVQTWGRWTSRPFNVYLKLSTEQKRTIFEQKFIKFLKRPKREMFVAGIFTENRSVWVGDPETRPKNLKSLCLGPYITHYFLGFLF